MNQILGNQSGKTKYPIKAENRLKKFSLNTIDVIEMRFAGSNVMILVDAYWLKPMELKHKHSFIFYPSI